MKRVMTFLSAFCVVAALCLPAASLASERTEANQILATATEVLKQFPDGTIPSAVLKQAYGIAIIPSVISAGFIAGGRYGKGVLLVRTADGRWSNPVFIKLYGGSFGFQAGISSTDLVLVFKTRRSVRGLSNGSFVLGADATATAGPVGRHAGASTNLHLDAEIYSYARSRGLFAGVALNGSRMSIADDTDWAYYGDSSLDADEILLRSSQAKLSSSGKQLVQTLNQEMPAYEGSELRSGGNDNAASDQFSDTSQDTRESNTANTQPTGANHEDRGVTVKRLDVENQASSNASQQTGHPDDGGDYGSGSYGASSY